MIETTRTTIPTDHPVHLMFRELTERGMQQLEMSDPDMIQYVSELLVRFIHIENTRRLKDDSGKVLEHMVDMLTAAEKADFQDSRREHYRHVGDLTLYNLGLFPEALTYGRRTLSPDYYAAQGRRSYAIVAGMERSGAEVFEKLAKEFHRCVDSLHWVRLYISDPFYQYMFRQFEIV